MTRKSIFAKINNQDGAALITVLVVFLTLVVIVTSSTYAALGNYERAKESSDHASAYYIAEAGLFEAKNYLNTFFEEKQGEPIESKFATDFIYAYAIEDTKTLVDTDKVETDYGKVMNLPAKSQVTLEYSGKENDSLRFTMKSKGFLGDETRVVETSFLITTEKVESEGEDYQPDAIVAITPPDSLGELPDMKLPAIGSTYIGPLITNRPIMLDTSPIFKGPLVTNNKFTFNLGYSSFEDTVLVSSSEIEFKQTESNINIKAIILKEDGTINFKKGYGYRTLSLNYLFLPYTSSVKLDQIIKVDGKPDKSNRELILKKTKIIYYNPSEYNPYTDDVSYVDNLQNMQKVEKDIIKKIFGEQPLDVKSKGYDYSDYFKNNFILDNMDDDNLVSKYIPTVKLPTRIKYEDEYPYGEMVVEKSARNVVYLDKNNNLNLTNKVFIDHPFELNLADETANSNYVRSFNSIKFGGGTGKDNPLSLLVEDKNIVLYTKTLEISRFLEVVGTGSLRIIVLGENGVINENHFKADNIGTIQTKDNMGDTSNNNSPQKFQLIVYETKNSRTGKPLTFKQTGHGSNFPLEISIFSQNLNLHSEGVFLGTFVSAKGESLYFANVGQEGQSRLIYAPNATLNFTGGTLKGVITAKDYNFGSNGTFGFDSDFDKSFIEDLLPEFIEIGGDTGDGSSGSSSSKNILQDSEIKEVGQ